VKLRVLVLSLLLATPLAGQQASDGGSVAGVIVDAESALPLAGATVTLEPRDGGALPGGASPALAASRTARTDVAGAYRFGGLARGDYRLRIWRIGYRQAELDVSLSGEIASQVSVGLQVQPVRLEPVRAQARTGRQSAEQNPFGRVGDRGEARLDAERARQEAFLAPDTRVVTAADVEEGVTFAESDLLRAMQRLPGVTARDDYSAELWTRGAPWDHTRVYFDGVPLYNPVHASGVFSGINPDAVGAVFFNPGAQGVSSAGGAAATLDVRSRRGGVQDDRRGTAELSLASLRAAFDGGGPNGGWMVAGRVGLGPVVGEVERRSRERDAWSTHGYLDFTARADRRLSGATSVESSLLVQADRFHGGPDSDWGAGSSSRWGSLAGRVTVDSRLSGVRARITLGGSGFLASARERDSIALGEQFFAWPSVFAARSRVAHQSVDLRLEPEHPGARRWAAGAGVARDEVEYLGPPAFPLDSVLPPTPVDRRDALLHGFGWAEGRVPVGDALTIEGGLRLEAGDQALHWAPRVAARLRAGSGLTLTGAAGRSFQRVQAGPELGEQSITQHFWMLAGARAPLLRSDVVALGGEGWLGSGWIGSVAGYRRRTRGAAVLDPSPGVLLGRPVFATGALSASGVDLSVRRLAGRWTGSASYSWGRSSTRVGEVRFASPADVRHSADLSARMQVVTGLHAGAAFTASSGGAYTRYYSGVAFCRLNLGCSWEELPRSGQPGALRAPGYASLDLTADWLRRWRGADFVFFVQLRNALGRENVARYNHSVHYSGCGFGSPTEDMPGCTEDLWSRGLPRLPVLGLRVSF
jgi:hypothetical protein